MSYLRQILQQVNAPLNIVIDGILKNVAASEAQAAARNGSLLTATGHQLSSQMFRISAVYDTIYFFFPSDHVLQKLQVVRSIALLPPGLFETASALWSGKKLLAFAYFNSIVLPGAISLADMLHKASLLSSNGLSVHRAGATYSTSRDYYNLFTNHTG